ncbi:DUF1819 family protein [Sulfitobacter mediterraneus]|uniref:DUF1819 family protein n=1 Tax=Sulfitobacter mediterraneus TaxID=83219 RepID=UPI0021A8914F|nr:DUF1819 family protein [Sulfitobacter mediterraneus]UWR10913.1 DUF1819 family protein [Sulfitobacter mediterraneus]
MNTQPYKMSFSTGGLFLNESIAVASLHAQGEVWKCTIDRALSEGTTSLPKSASNRRTLREISNRLSTLAAVELEFFIEDADRIDQMALLWLATCRAYRFVREYAIEVLRERYLSYRLDLPLETFDILLDSKAELDDDLSSLSPSTRLKLRQVMFRMMREAGVITKDNRIQTTILSKRLINLIEQKDPGELAFFPSVPVEGA